jgi:predicted nucleic acid-binding Zn finger protein
MADSQFETKSLLRAAQKQGRRILIRQNLMRSTRTVFVWVGRESEHSVPPNYDVAATMAALNGGRLGVPTLG